MNALRTGLIAAGLAVGAALSACPVAPYGYYDGGDVGYYGGVYAPYGYDYGGWGGGYRVGPPRGGEHGGYRGVGGGPGGPGGGHGGGDHGGGSHGGGGHGGGAPGIPTGSRGGGHR